MAKERFEKKGTKKEYKTDTIMERAVLVYLPTKEKKEEWQDLAEKSGLSLSKFILEHVENSLSQEKDDELYQPRAELIKEVKELKEETAKLRKRNEMLDKVIEKLEEELREYRAMPFIDETFQGIREYEKPLIQLFKEKKQIKKGEIYDLLGIDPMKEPDVVKGINKQIENLEGYGLIEDKGRTWKWKV